MIGNDLEEARNVLADIVALSPFASLDSDLAKLCTDVIQTVSKPDIPGALVPVIDASGNFQINVAIPTVSDWRRLKPILLAFAGPTLTSFNGVPEAFERNGAICARIMQTQPAVTAIMRLPSEKRAQVTALRAVLRALDTLTRAPQLQRTAPVPTSWLLARFQDYLNVGRRQAALDVLERLNSELRLDALNIKFLQIQLLATFQDWTGIVSLTEFADLCVARKTPAVTAILLEALYRTHLEGSFEAKDIEDTRSRFEKDVRQFTLSMVLVPPPSCLGVEGLRIYALEALLDLGSSSFLEMLNNRTQDLGWLADMLPIPVPSKAFESEFTTPLDGAREALLRAGAIDSNDLVADAMSLLARLSTEELALLHETMPFRPILQVTDELANVAPPISWIAWLERTSDPYFVDALDVARHGKDEWEIETSVSDPIEVLAFVNAINKVQGDGLAAERTTQALPYLVAWLQRDPEFPRTALSSIYAELLTLFALGSARGAVTYESTQILIEALLSAGVDQKAYRDLIADIEEITGDGFGVGMIYWVLEIVETFMSSATPDAAAREAFLHSILARITPIYTRLTELQCLAVNLLSTEHGWTLPSLPAVATPQTDQIMAARLAGIRITIYSLTESSSRQAKVALEQITSTVIVDINADHGGTARLRALAENSDLFVITWLSAKHAATDFIRTHRGDRPLIYAKGKGFSSILRAIEEHFT